MTKCFIVFTRSLYKHNKRNPGPSIRPDANGELPLDRVEHILTSIPDLVPKCLVAEMGKLF